MKNLIFIAASFFFAQTVSAYTLKLNLNNYQEDVSNQIYSEIDVAKDSSIFLNKLHSKDQFTIKTISRESKGSCFIKLYDANNKLVQSNRSSLGKEGCSVFLTSSPIFPSPEGKKPESPFWNLTPQMFSSGRIEVVLMGSFDNLTLDVTREGGKTNDRVFFSTINGNGAYRLVVPFTTK